MIYKTMKTCPRCKCLKEENLFSKNKSRKDGLSCYCKNCTSQLWQERNYRVNCINWRFQNKEKSRELARKWRLADLLRDSLRVQRRRARKKGNGGNITTQEWKFILDKYAHKCLRCGKSDVKLTMDHIKPLALGGTNTIDNVQPLCVSCNSWKSTKYIDFRSNYEQTSAR